MFISPNIRADWQEGQIFNIVSIRRYGRVQIWSQKPMESIPDDNIPTSPQTAPSVSGDSSSSSRADVEWRMSQLTLQTTRTSWSQRHKIPHARSIIDGNGREALVLKEPPTLVAFLELDADPMLKYLCIESAY
jgi:hypothetical protein